MVRTGVLAVQVDGSAGVAQIRLQRGSSVGAGQNHWRPIFLAAFLAEGRRAPRYPGNEKRETNLDG